MHTHDIERENVMFRFVWLTIAMFAGALATVSQTTSANAVAATPLQVLQIEKFLQPDPLAQKAHGWHCRRRVGPYGWHRHPRACGGYYDDPYDDPYYDDGPYYDGGPAIVIKPRRRYRCTRRARRNCYRNWRHSSKRRKRCLRKYGCR